MHSFFRVSVITSSGRMLHMLRYLHLFLYLLLTVEHLHGHYRFLYTSCNCVGSTHDNTAFQHNALYRAIVEVGGLPDGMYLVGDEAYVAADWMLVPYSGQQLPADKDATNFYISLGR